MIGLALLVEPLSDVLAHTPENTGITRQIMGVGATIMKMGMETMMKTVILIILMIQTTLISINFVDGVGKSFLLCEIEFCAKLQQTYISKIVLRSIDI